MAKSPCIQGHSWRYKKTRGGQEVRPTVRDLGQKRHQKRRMVLDEWRMGRHLLCVAVVSQMVTVALRICWCGWCPGSKLLPLSVANALRYVSRVRYSAHLGRRLSWSPMTTAGTMNAHGSRLECVLRSTCPHPKPWIL